MARAFDEVIRVPTDAGHVAVHRRVSAGRPAMLMTHGTGFCASTWLGVVEHVSDAFEVLSIDRRGHGHSSTPDDAYDFTDFARDAVCVIDALGLRDAYAVGHSAGATDLLLAAAERPGAFRRMFVIEPTAMDPAEPAVRADMAPHHERALADFARRRASFPSRAEVLERYTDRGVFTGWRADILEAFVRDGFADDGDHADDADAAWLRSGVTLRCSPAHEVAMLRRIFAAMEGTYGLGSADHPFDALRLVQQPTLVVTTEHSSPIYRQMAEVVRRLVPDASHVHLDGLGHAAAQVDPERVAAEVVRFWSDDALS